MRFSRRALLTASAVGLAAYRGAPLLGSEPTATDRGRFPGDPGHDRLYFGASLQYGRSLSDWERQLGCTLAIHHTFYRRSAPEVMVTQARKDLANHRLPHLSVKPPASWSAVAGGDCDAWLHGLLAPLARLDQPVFLTVAAEPESEEQPRGYRPSDFAAMQRHLIALNRSYSAGVTVVPVLMAWTFDPRSGRDIDAWYVPQASVVGVDAYNPWRTHGSAPWRNMATLLAPVVPYVGATPLVIAEYGCRTPRDDPERATDWMVRANDFALAHNVVAMEYFNSDVGADGGSWELDRVRGRVFQRLLRTTSARIP